MNKTPFALMRYKERTKREETISTNAENSKILLSKTLAVLRGTKKKNEKTLNKKD